MQLGYVHADHKALLGGICNDVHHVPLEFFKPARGNSERSRFEMLLLDDDNEKILICKVNDGLRTLTTMTLGKS